MNDNAKWDKHKENGRCKNNVRTLSGPNKLALDDSAHGASTSTSTAVHASARIDLITGIALGDSTSGAGTCAGTASDTTISNNVCHLSILLI